MEKFAEKQLNSAISSSANTTSKNKEKKAKQAQKDEPVPQYVEETPPGEKKSLSISHRLRWCCQC